MVCSYDLFISEHVWGGKENLHNQPRSLSKTHALAKQDNIKITKCRFRLKIK